jgi:hypothetical protein
MTVLLFLPTTCSPDKFRSLRRRLPAVHFALQIVSAALLETALPKQTRHHVLRLAQLLTEAGNLGSAGIVLAQSTAWSVQRSPVPNAMQPSTNRRLTSSTVRSRIYPRLQVAQQPASSSNAPSIVSDNQGASHHKPTPRSPRPRSASRSGSHRIRPRAQRPTAAKSRYRCCGGIHASCRRAPPLVSTERPRMALLPLDAGRSPRR